MSAYKLRQHCHQSADEHVCVCVGQTGMRRAPMKLIGEGSASLFTTTTGWTGTHTLSLGSSSSVSQPWEQESQMSRACGQRHRCPIDQVHPRQPIIEGAPLPTESVNQK